MNNFRYLRADEITLRVGQANAQGFTLLLYKDARCDQNILDETFGIFGWQRKHYELKGNIYCSVGIYDSTNNQWIWKDDCGTESNAEKEKGEASDSFKRACFNWGIGRELYTSPFIYIRGNTEQKNGKYISTIKRFKVISIDYEAGKIKYLAIQGDKDVIFEYGINS